MHKDKFIKARLKLGLTQSELAKVLRMSDNSDRTIRRYESGQCAIPGPTSVAIEAILAGYTPQ